MDRDPLPGLRGIQRVETASAPCRGLTTPISTPRRIDGWYIRSTDGALMVRNPCGPGFVNADLLELISSVSPSANGAAGTKVRPAQTGDHAQPPEDGETARGAGA